MSAPSQTGRIIQPPTSPPGARCAKYARLPGEYGPLLLALLWLVSPAAGAIEVLTTRFAQIAGAGWSAEGLEVSLTLLPRPAVDIRVAQARLDAPRQIWTDLRLDCSVLHIDEPVWRCSEARLTGNSSSLGPQRYTATLSVDTRTRSLRLDAHGGPVAESPLSVSLRAERQAWSLEFGLGEATLSGILALMGSAADLSLPLEAEAGVALKGRLEGNARGLARLTLTAGLTDLSGGNAEGTLATEALELAATVHAAFPRGNTDFALTLTARTGQLYAEPLFLDLAAAPVTIEVEGSRSADGSIIDISSWRYLQPGSVQTEGSARLATTATGTSVAAITCEQLEAQLPSAYERYVKPFAYGTPFDDLATAGRIRMRFATSGLTPREVDLTLAELDIEDRADRFAVQGASGRIVWHDDASREDPAVTENLQRSAVRWKHAAIYGLPAGAAELRFAIAGRRFRLLAPLVLPFLDGSLRVDRLEYDEDSAGTPAFALDARLEPVSLLALTTALGWPAFGGKLAGRLPSLSYRDGELMLGGKLEADVFSGRVEIDHLRVLQPFGDLPQLFADLRIFALDMKQLTDTFSFGRITGSLEGEVLGLHMINWHPVAFDAWLATPADDPRRHRISQRAVENLASVSGGPSAVLSSGVMALFDDFAYGRLGLRCRLENGVCVMGGVEDAENGYYIVRGKWLPRIDVIGHRSRVDWERLVAQLKSIAASGEVTVR